MISTIQFNNGTQNEGILTQNRKEITFIYPEKIDLPLHINYLATTIKVDGKWTMPKIISVLESRKSRGDWGKRPVPVWHRASVEWVTVPASEVVKVNHLGEITA